ncbi:hypothetical protein N1851_005108 [Merluccius polli]|uniref:Uncharacterized protein n=1 Tax=Merluccius polli TaxID=89951 RepID=A0AA47PBD3_MERPO|nr:hypothetical protein N1851_005108 [Merluccius polli]
MDYHPGMKRRRRRRERRQKRGCRSGVRARLSRQPHKPSLPSLFITNARSLPNKIEELELTISTQKNIQDCCVMVITDTWLTPTIPAEAQASGPHSTPSRQDTRLRGGGLCVYTNTNWCTNAVTTDTYCSPDVEYLSVRCRPFYMPRKFTVIIITAVYIPPDANTKTALDSLLTVISNQQRDHPDGVYVIAVLDSNIKHGLKTSPLPHLGQFDHISLFLTQAYRPRICTSRPTTKVLQVWPEGASEQLRDCFSDTDWTIFEEDNIDTYSASMTTVVGLITKGDESAYREEVQRLTEWCSENNLSLNIKKTKELIIDYRKKQDTHTPLHINGERVERVSSFKFLGIHISENLSWTTNTTAIVKKAQQRSFYRCSIESVLTYGILLWYGSSSAADRKTLQRTIKTTQNIINQQLPTMDTIFNSRCLQKTQHSERLIPPRQLSV